MIINPGFVYPPNSDESLGIFILVMRHSLILRNKTKVIHLHPIRYMSGFSYNFIIPYECLCDTKSILMLGAKI